VTGLDACVEETSRGFPKGRGKRRFGSVVSFDVIGLPLRLSRA
jgi:hypothetical protein